MKPEEKKILNDSLSKLFKIDSETLASLYNEAGDLIDFSEVMKLDAERIAKYKSENDSQFKRGVKEAMVKFEGAVKEKYEIESDAVGVDLVDQLILKKVEEVKSSPKDISKHPEVIKMQLENEKKLKEKDKEWAAKMEAREKEIKKSQLFERVAKRGLVNLRKRNPILPSDPVKAQYWEDAYLNELRKREYMENGEDLVVLGEDGKPLQNDHGNSISFDEFTNDRADRIFEFPKAEERSSPGNKDKPGTASQNGFNPPKTEEEYIARQKDPKITPQERIELTNYWTNLKK